MTVPTDPLKIAGAHQRAIIDHLARIRADQGCISQLLVGRHCTSSRRDGVVWRITKVRSNGASASIEVFGIGDGMSGKARLIARGLDEIKLVASNKQTSSTEKASS